MLLRGFSVMLFSGIFLCATAGAAVFERDWQTPGDGLLTFDDVNNREWLDLSETILDQFLGAGPGALRGEDLEVRYQNVVSELGPDGKFEGFVIASSSDVFGLAESTGIDITSPFSIENLSSTMQLINLLGLTFDSTFSNQKRAMGFIDELTNQSDPFALKRFTSIFSAFNCNAGCAGLSIVEDEDLIAADTTGVMLLRITIPEPSSLILVATFIFRPLAIHPRSYALHFRGFFKLIPNWY